MSLRLLVTRPEPEASRLAGVLRARGHRAVVAPLMRIVFRDGAPIETEAYRGVLATSANGIRALARRSRVRNIAVFAVGRATADAASAEGFHNVRSAGGDAGDLAARVREWTDPEQGPLLHVAGSVRAGDLKGALEAAGFAVTRLVLYDAVAAKRLPQAAAGALTAGALDGVLFYSRRTARLFCSLIGDAGLGDACRGAAAYVLSPAIAAVLRPAGFAAVHVAATPDETALLALLG